MQFLWNLVFSFASICVAAGGTPPSTALKASRPGSENRPYVFVSPDRKFEAVLTVGEAEATHLLVRSHPATKAPQAVDENSVTGILWDPAKPHRLIYSESGIYGTGKIAVWNDGKQTVLWKKDKHVEDLRWDRKAGRLTFLTMDIDGGSTRKSRQSIAFR